MPSAHWQGLVSADQRHGDNIHLRLNCQVESSSHKLHQVSTLGASAFGKNHDWHIVFQSINAAMQAPQRHAHVLEVYRNLPRTGQMPAHKWIAKKFSLGQYSELKGQLRIDYGDIQRRKMIDHVDMGTSGVDLLQSLDVNGSAD